MLLALLMWVALSDGRPIRAAQAQHFTLIFGSWTPGATPLNVQDFNLQKVLTDEDRALLAQALSGGDVRIQGSTASNPAGLASPRARMIVLFTERLPQAVRLPQPDATAVVYVQEGAIFRRFPAAVPLLDRFVNLTPSGEELIAFTVESPSGNHGGTRSVSLASATPATSGGTSASPARGASVQATKVKDVAPVFPPKALAIGITGTVVLEVLVDVEGRVSEARVLRSPSSLFDQAAIDCVRQWEYAPAFVSGVPTPIRMSVTVNFVRP